MAQQGVQLDTESSVSAAAEEDVTAAVSELTDQLQTVSLEAAQPDGLLPPEPETPEAETPEPETPEAETPEPETPEPETPEPETPEAETPEPETPEPETRADFLRWSRDITLDPNTANGYLLLSERNRKVTRTNQPQSYPEHPDRFTDRLQVMSRKSLTGRCYWEVELRGGRFIVAVAYKNISRKGNESRFGYNDKSWALYCDGSSPTFRFNSIETSLSAPRSYRVGVYLDHRAGILSFYRVSETMTLLHRVQTTFTQPLYAGLWVHLFGSSAELCEPR